MKRLYFTHDISGQDIVKLQSMNSRSLPVWMKWGIVFGLTILYLAASLLLTRWIGSAAMSFGLFPVLAAGLLFGLPGGVTASLLIVVTNVLLWVFVEGIPLGTLTGGGYIFGSILLIFIGLISGYNKSELDKRLEVEGNLRSHEQHLALLNNMIKFVMVSDDFEIMSKILVRDLAKLFGADDCYLIRWDPEKKQAIPVVTTAKLERSFAETRFPPGEVNIALSTLDAAKILVVEDVSRSPDASTEWFRQFPIRSLISIPLIFDNSKLGVAIIAHNTLHKFSAEDIQLAEQAGSQIALAWWDTQQDIDLQQRLRETNTLANIARTLSETEYGGLKRVLQLIVTSVKELIPNAERTVVHMLDEDQQILIPEEVSGFDKPAMGKMNMHLGEGVAGQVLASGKAVYIPDVQEDPRFISLKGAPQLRSLIVAPVQSGTQKLGTISVQNNAPNAFTSEESRLLSLLGTQAANACLLEITKNSLKETDALYRINQELVATIDPDQLMEDVVVLLQENFGYSYVQIFVMDPDNDDFILRAGTGEIGKKLKAMGLRIAVGDGIIGYTAETGTPFFTNDVDAVVFYVPNPLLPEAKSELSVPIKIGGKFLGIIDIQQVPPDYLTQRDLQLVSAVADQLAVALQKAILYADLQTSLRQEQATRSQLIHSERLAAVGRLLASVSHELNNPLQAIQNALFLLKEEKGISGQGRQDLDIVLSETERMSAMLERLRTAYQPIRVEDFLPVQVNTLIEDVHALVATHLRHNGIAFEFLFDPDLPAIPGLVDQLRQVVLNLFMNAVDAMPNGGDLRVSTWLQAETREVLITITDTGHGIDPFILPNIFDAFVTNKEHGTGLGLTISYEIVTKHRGRIQAVNNAEGGATFSVWLPVEQRNEK
jgi:signal transduction histidine kinase